MPTSDGISDHDWSKVHSLALFIVKVSLSSNRHAHKVYKEKMLRCLMSLEKKYGQLPSILATRADYTVGNKQKETLFLRAYQLSQERKDFFNQAEIAHSLAVLYIEYCRRHQEGLKWLKKLKVHIRKAKGKDLKEEYDRLCSLAREKAASRWN